MNNLLSEINRKHAKNSSHYFSGKFRRGKIIDNQVAQPFPLCIRLKGCHYFSLPRGKGYFLTQHTVEREKTVSGFSSGRRLMAEL